MPSVRGQPQAAYSPTHTSQIIQMVSLTLLRQINTSRTVYFPCNTIKIKLICSTSVYMQYFKQRKILTKQPTNQFMQQSPSWEADSCSASYRIPCILWNPSVHTTAHHLPLSWARWIQFTPSHHTSLRCTLQLFSHLHLGFPSSPFHSGFPIHLLTNVCCMSHCHWFDHPNYIRWTVQTIKLLTVQFSPVSCYLFPLSHSNIFHNTLLLNTLTVTDQDPHKATGQIIPEKLWEVT